MSLKSTIDDLHKYRNLVLLVFLFGMVSTLSFLAAGNMDHSSAASLSGFKPGNIISDGVMGNYNSMTKDEIQAFLTKKNPCGNTSVSQYQSLKAQYPSIDWHFENGHFVCLSEEKFGDGVEIGKGQTAAEIIYQAAQDYRINPQVLIVLLEKEQSLITDTYPNTKQYRSATGYGCPDTAACDTKYYGFKNQVRNAAALFRNVLDNGYSAYPEKKSGVYIGYNPNSSCGRSEVYIENRATAALYRYTPYQPNAAALAAGYGTGDGCSAYGNRNFYLYFTDWFGSTQISVSGEQVTIPDGVYSIAPKKNLATAMVPAGKESAENANIELQARTSASYSQWKVQRDAKTGYYSITDTRSGRKLAAVATSFQNGTNVVTKTDSSCASQWRVYETSDHYLTFESVCSTGYVLDYAAAQTSNGTNVSVWTTHGGDAQKWTLYAGKTIENGVYTISSAHNAAKMLDIHGSSNANGTNIEIYDNNNYNNQKWRIEYNATGDYYTFTNPMTGKLLDLSGANTTPGTNVRLWEKTNSCAQRWRIFAAEDNKYTIVSTCSMARNLNLYNGSTKNGTNVQLWSIDNSNSSKWRFHNQKVLAEGNYEIAAKNNQNYVLDIYGGYDVDETNVEIFSAHHTPASQLWYLQYNAQTGDYTLQNQSRKRSLDLYGGTSSNGANGTNIQLFANHGGCAQRWNIVKNSDQTYTLLSTCTYNDAVDLKGGNTTNQNNIQLWDANNGNAQKWYFIKK